jgi:hypothetical protein
MLATHLRRNGKSIPAGLGFTCLAVGLLLNRFSPRLDVDLSSVIGFWSGEFTQGFLVGFATVLIGLSIPLNIWEFRRSRRS